MESPSNSLNRVHTSRSKFFFEGKFRAILSLTCFLNGWISPLLGSIIPRDSAGVTKEKEQPTNNKQQTISPSGSFHQFHPGCSGGVARVAHQVDHSRNPPLLRCRLRRCFSTSFSSRLDFQISGWCAKHCVRVIVVSRKLASRARKIPLSTLTSCFSTSQQRATSHGLSRIA